MTDREHRRKIKMWKEAQNRCRALEIQVTKHAQQVLGFSNFSENYSCGYSSEIQSVHFGASHNQATLHTGILYVDQDTVSFCTISDSRVMTQLQYGHICHQYLNTFSTITRKSIPFISYRTVLPHSTDKRRIFTCFVHNCIKKVLRVVVPGTFQRQDIARVQRMGLEVS